MSHILVLCNDQNPLVYPRQISNFGTNNYLEQEIAKQRNDNFSPELGSSWAFNSNRSGMKDRNWIWGWILGKFSDMMFWARQGWYSINSLNPQPEPTLFRIYIIYFSFEYIVKSLFRRLSPNFMFHISYYILN